MCGKAGMEWPGDERRGEKGEAGMENENTYVSGTSEPWRRLAKTVDVLKKSTENFKPEALFGKVAGEASVEGDVVAGDSFKTPLKMRIVEAKHIVIADVTCSDCHMNASLDVDRLCEFCRRPKAPERYSGRPRPQLKIMANKTSIEWTDYNWNFLRGCSRVSEGCRNCYAEGVAARLRWLMANRDGLARSLFTKTFFCNRFGGRNRERCSSIR